MADLTKVKQLESQLGKKWEHLDSARALTIERQAKMEPVLEGFTSPDVSIVMFGSLARCELTQGSDPDWTLLIDGEAAPNHLDMAQDVGGKLLPLFAKAPGQENTFGTPVFSHQLVHQIGGEDDTNKNTTRRILLLLESAPIGRRDAYDRVVNCVLYRYLLEDRTFALKRSKYHVPRFLLNDIARYWRTMAVDFAYKARARQGKGFAIRNFKLRMSRKLIYVSGMLSSFACQLKMAQTRGSAECEMREEECVSCLRTFMCRPPLEVLADVLIRLGPDAHNSARNIMGAYNEFIGILADKEARSELETLSADDFETESGFSRARDVSHQFRDGLLSLFFEVKPVAELTKIYGVF